jgi:hypothetical protein
MDFSTRYEYSRKPGIATLRSLHTYRRQILPKSLGKSCILDRIDAHSMLELQLFAKLMTLSKNK